MHLEQINDRLETLYTVLYFCSNYSNVLTRGQKICINQECGSLLDKKAFLFQAIKDLDKVRMYQVPPEIECKIEYVMQQIRNFKYYTPPPNRFTYE